MSGLAARRGTPLLGVLAAGVVAGAFLVSAGLFTIDELIYFMSADAMARRGALTVENGFEIFGSEDLKLWFLVEGPRGLAPQYPPGAAVAGAPLVALLGPRGLILLNALAAAATLFLTRALARRMFRDARVALAAPVILLLGTFWLEYAWGAWPHAVAVCATTAAFFCALRALEPPAGGTGWALAAGLAVGAGFLFRVDAILALPAIGAMALLYSRRPARMIAAGAAGLAPGLGAAALANWIKFGTFNPLSYGRSGGGGTDFATYLPLAAAALGGLALLLAFRRLDRRGGRLLALGVVGAGAGLALAAPPLGAALARFLEGAHALLIDIAVVEDPRLEAARESDRILSFWGLAKKALGQSLPWLGLLALLLVRPWPEDRRRAYLLCLLAAGSVTAPFLMLSWHGGLGSNMRYFLTLLPVLSALGARLGIDLLEAAQDRGRSGILGLAAGGALVLWWQRQGPETLFGAHQILSTWLLGAVALATLLAGWRGAGERRLAQGAQAAAGAGFAAALILGLQDLGNSQLTRRQSAQAWAMTAHVAPPSLIHGVAPAFALQTSRENGLLALADRLTMEVDGDLLRAAAERGYTVFLQESWSGPLLARRPDLRLGERRIALPGGALVEVETR